ncbi:MAG: hypothetical protein RIK85_00060, partial [Marinobacter sp.]
NFWLKLPISNKHLQFEHLVCLWVNRSEKEEFPELLNFLDHRHMPNRGIALSLCNPAYTSLIGLVKYSRMYGLSSDVAAALAIARRGMNLSERLPRSVS